VIRRLGRASAVAMSGITAVIVMTTAPAYAADVDTTGSSAYDGGVSSSDDVTFSGTGVVTCSLSTSGPAHVRRPSSSTVNFNITPSAATTCNATQPGISVQATLQKNGTNIYNAPKFSCQLCTGGKSQGSTWSCNSSETACKGTYRVRGVFTYTLSAAYIPTLLPSGCTLNADTVTCVRYSNGIKV